jgi:hypothetical protein
MYIEYYNAGFVKKKKKKKSIIFNVHHYGFSPAEPSLGTTDVVDAFSCHHDDVIIF